MTERASITPKSRERFRAWSAALDELTPEEREAEAEAWIVSALRILSENGRVSDERGGRSVRRDCRVQGG